ncbi:hypothetical protein [Spirulina major]|uniref:hypothetical protein n=1 Tax=Spirulina major TaxID=270636 RepID=UPI001114B2A5|nr:hypothetical protein [Spirulina major]
MKLREMLLWGGLLVTVGGAIAIGGLVYRHRTITYTPPELEVVEITRSQLEDLLIPVNYGGLINQSLAGDAPSLRRLIRLARHTNGGGAYGFGAVLAKIALQIGDQDFFAAIQPLSSPELGRLHHFLGAGFEYGVAQSGLEDFADQLPQTYTLTAEHAGIE